MTALTERLQLPASNFIGGRNPGTITTLGPGAFQLVDERFPVATSEMLVLVDNAIVFVDNELVYI